MPLPKSGLLHPRFHQAVQASAVGNLGLPDACVVTRPGTGEGTVDDHGTWHPPTPVEIYAGGCRCQARPTDDTVVVVGQQVVTLHRYYIGIRADADQVLVDDIVEMTDSRDQPLLGRNLIVRSVHYDTFLARRLLVCDDHPDIATAELDGVPLLDHTGAPVLDTSGGRITTPFGGD